MDLTKLATLVAVIDAGGFAAAGRALHLSQPAVSQHIAQLERQTGLALFERAGRRRIPTEAGLALADTARRAIAGLAETERTARELRGLERGRLRVAASTTPGIYMVPRALGAFRARHPGIDVQLDISDTFEVERKLQSRSADVAVLGQYDAPEELMLAPFRLDYLVAICSERGDLAQDTSLDEFLSREFVARKRGSSTRDIFERWLQERGRRLRPRMEFASTEAVKQAVAADLGVSVVSGAAIEVELSAGLLRTLALPGFPIVRRINVALVRGRRPSPATEAFLHVLMGLERANALSEIVSNGESPAQSRLLSLQEEDPIAL